MSPTLRAMEIIDELLEKANISDFGSVAIKAGTIAKKLKEETGSKHAFNPVCANALKKRFRQGQDFARGGRDRHRWSETFPQKPTSTIEVLFEIRR